MFTRNLRTRPSMIAAFSPASSKLRRRARVERSLTVRRDLGSSTAEPLRSRSSLLAMCENAGDAPSV